MHSISSEKHRIFCPPVARPCPSSCLGCGHVHFTCSSIRSLGVGWVRIHVEKGLKRFASFVHRLSRLSYLGSFAVSCTLLTFCGGWVRPHPPLPRIIANTRSMHMHVPESLFLYSPITYPFAAPSPFYNLVGK